MKKIVVLGAGITGLTIGRLLSNKATVKILEKKAVPGGIARTKDVNGVTYHTVGGHCFNSKHKDVLDFVFSIMPQDQWHKIQRISRIAFDGYEIDYPIEYSVREIYAHDPQLAFEISRDFLATSEDISATNLGEWFSQKFGGTLAAKYFIPYNRKIWGRDPYTMAYSWVEGKLPIPDKKSFFDALITDVSDSMPHSSFYYPNTNNQNSLIEALASGLDIDFDTPVKSIEKDKDGWIVNGNIRCDIIISTLPLNELPSLIRNTPQEIIDEAALLRYNKVSNVLWESRPTEKSWTYHPDSDTLFHRYIHIGSYFKPVAGYTITECVGEHSYDEMVAAGSRDPFLIRPLDHNISEHAYVVFDENRDKAVDSILSYLSGIGIESIGRFGRWEYYNMDICMKQCLDLYSQLQSDNLL